MPGPMDTNYGTRDQVEYARAMAAYLRKQKGMQMTPGMAVLPGSWMYNLGHNLVDPFAINKYEEIAGQQDRTLKQRELTGDMNYVAPRAPATVAGSLSDYVKKNASKWFGGGDSKVISPGTEPRDKDLITGSVTPQVDEMSNTPSINYADEVKKIENGPLYEGKTKTSRAQWDFQQHTNGFGTKAKNEGEEIGTEEAHKRFDSEWQKAENQVDQFKPGLPRGPRAALTSLTFNSGTKWMDSGLGAAVQADDPVKSKELFTQYNKVRDKNGQMYTLAGLKERRDKEANWFDDVTPTTGGMPQAPSAKLPGQIGGGAVGEDTARVAANQDQRLAQAPSYGMKPVGTPPPTEPIQNIPGGYQGVVLPRNPVRTPGQLEGAIMNAPGGTERAIIDQHMKDLQGRTVETPGGGKLNIPGDTNAPVTHIPGPDMNDFMGMPGLRARQQPDGSIKLLTPSGSEIPATIEGINKYKAELERQRTQIQKIGEAQVKPIEDAIEHANAAPDALRKLNSMESIARAAPALDMGPTAGWFKQAKQFFSNFLPDRPGLSKDIESADTIEKLTSLLASEQTKSFTNRGSNFDLQTFMRANANLGQSKEGMYMIIDIMKQEAKQAQEIGRIANRYRDKDPASWSDRKQEYFESHPIIIHKPIQGKPNQYEDIVAKKYENTKEVEKDIESGILKSGQGFMRPNGTIGYAP